MSTPQQDEDRHETPPADASAFQRVYFDTSVWNHLTDARDRDMLIRSLQRRRIPFASVISIAEILGTSDLNKRADLCGTIRALHGDRPLLERPMDLAEAAAEAFLKREDTLCAKESGPARTLYDALTNPSDAPVSEINNWLDNMDQNLEGFIDKIKPPSKDEATNYLSPIILERSDFLSSLCQFPPARKLNLSPAQMRELCRASDIWRALGATLAYIIQLSTTHSPKWRKVNSKRIRRPGGPDIWQTVYLGCVEVFVTGDTWMLEAAAAVSSLLKWPRCTVHSLDLIEGMRAKANTCHICGSLRNSGRGLHVKVC